MTHSITLTILAIIASGSANALAAVETDGVVNASPVEAQSEELAREPATTVQNLPKEPTVESTTAVSPDEYGPPPPPAQEKKEGQWNNTLQSINNSLKNSGLKCQSVVDERGNTQTFCSAQ